MDLCNSNPIPSSTSHIDADTEEKDQLKTIDLSNESDRHALSCLCVDGSRIGSECICLAGFRNPYKCGEIVHSKHNVVPLACLQAKETRQVWREVWKSIPGGFPKTCQCKNHTKDKLHTWFLHYLVCSDLLSWTYLSNDESNSMHQCFCPYCLILFAQRHEEGPPRESWDSVIFPEPIPANKFVFCALHADIRITEQLLRALWIEYYTLNYCQQLSEDQLVAKFNSTLEAIGIRTFHIRSVSKTNAAAMDNKEKRPKKSVHQLKGVETKLFKVTLVSKPSGEKQWEDTIFKFFNTLFPSLFAQLQPCPRREKHGRFLCSTSSCSCQKQLESLPNDDESSNLVKIHRILSLWYAWRDIAHCLRTKKSLDVSDNATTFFSTNNLARLIDKFKELFDL
jgi:hypothetical protein